jgi:hypothetical protein
VQGYNVCLQKYSIKACGKYADISRWEGKCSVCRDAQYFMSQSLIVTMHTDVWKRSLENHFLDLDMNGNVLLDIGVKELVRKMIVYPEVRWVVFGCCGVLFVNKY